MNMRIDFWVFDANLNLLLTWIKKFGALVKFIVFIMQINIAHTHH